MNVTYIGKRVVGENIRQAFLTPDDQTIYFSNVKFVCIGTQYKATKKKDTFSIERVPKEAGSVKDESKIEVWRIEEQLANDFAARKRASVKSAKSETITRLASILRPLAEEFTARQLRDVLMLAVDEATKEIREEEKRRFEASLNRLSKKTKVKA